MKKINKINEVLFLCFGDSHDISTWSNVPYLFAKELEHRGIKVRRINLDPKSFLYPPLYFILKVIYHFICKFYAIIYKDSDYNFCRSSLYNKIVERKIKCEVKKFHNIDLCIFLTFDFYNKFTNTPTLLFGDWTYDIRIARRNRKMNPIEKKIALHELDVINKSQYTFTMFPETAQHLEDLHVKSRVFYLDMNMVNNVYDGNVDENIIKRKNEKKKVLFIGRKHYLESAIKTIKAVEMANPNIELNIIGLSSEDVTVSNSTRIKFHGFLHKDELTENRTYYNLLLSSSLIINADPVWGGFSSMIEAMFFYTPVIVSPYRDFVRTFGETINFGIYNTDFSTECIANNINLILNNYQYEQMCINAHNAVKNFTWSNFVDRMIKEIQLVKS